MASKGIPNKTLDQVLIDLDRVLNQDFSVLYGKGNEELDAVSKQLGGLLVQTNDVKINDFHNAKSYFIQQGSSEEAATTLALAIANIAKLSNTTYDSVIREITDRGIEFSDETYLKINSLRQPTSQLFKFTPNLNLDKTYKSVCISPINFEARSVTLVGSDFDELMLTSYDSTVWAFVDIHIVSDYDTLSLTQYDSVIQRVFRAHIVSDYDTLSLTQYDSIVYAFVNTNVISDYDSMSLLSFDSIIVVGSLGTEILDELGSAILDESGNPILEE